MNMKKIVFLTYHNWETKRQGGFHKFAEGACERGYDTIFFSFPRPYYIYFKNEERLNKHVLKKLTKGEKYNIGSNELLNITFPTLALPGQIRKIIPGKINFWLQQKSFRSFKKFSEKYFAETNYFVFESNESLLLFNRIKKLFPKSCFIYRPSDPLLADPSTKISEYEKKILPQFDWIFLVNTQGFQVYKKHISNFDTQSNYSILSNGVSLHDYQKNYVVPEPLKNSNTVLYVGALVIEWSLIVEASKRLKKFNFVIVCPENPPTSFIKHVYNNSNIIYINGISPENVPAWVTNCDIIIVPNPKNLYKAKPWGITAKYYQAMAAKKPIIAYHDTPELEKFGIKCTYDYDSFIMELKNCNFSETVNYDFNFEEKDWRIIIEKFFSKIESL